ncbi:EAL domain-containing protein [Citrobacter enshiensis]|uniref:EAL domain-containing protein n=1 Tax=Citrobacter enshiensis TaxID=2971264 RepID=UPI0023E75977|nr:EAL domain-containing protein [Citrobacter enshiensis]WET39916.1 EAL domain-containing protein [Citrobacter enshiensis]
MNRLSEPALYTPELPRNAELTQITGIRLQRIHFFHDAARDVREVLSLVQTPMHLDLFFQRLSVTAKQQLFLWQMQRVLALRGCFSLNLSVRMLTCQRWVSLLTEQAHEGRIIIEIQDPGTMMRLEKAEQQVVCAALNTLIRYGFRIWLDDVSPAQFFIWRQAGIQFDAVKIETGLFHQFRTSGSQLTILVNQFRGLGGRVVIEGVETPEDYAICRVSGADAVQGYLFEQEVLPEDFNPQ